MGTIFTVSNKSTVLVNKLRGLISEVQNTSGPQGTQEYQTYDEVAAKVFSLLSQYYSALDKPIFNPFEAQFRLEPELLTYNLNFSNIELDLNVVYSEFENLEQVILSSFNFMVSRLNRLKGRLKQAASRLADYSLYSIFAGNCLFFSDSFNNLERVECRSPLLKEPDELEVGQEEGIVLLPIDSTATSKVTITTTPVINSNSNGTSGNNYEFTSVKNSDITKVLDYNADTWFEYERVLNIDDGKALILDITINLGKDEIINFIRINPNNFGTKTQLEVMAIQVSGDGKTYDNIVDDLLAPDLVNEETGTLLIAPSTSKYAGQGVYSFIPKKTRFVRITFRQSTPYVMTTSTGEKRFRYAIGLKDIHIEKKKYKERGELISKRYDLLDSNDPIRKVVVETQQSPTPLEIDSLGKLCLGKLTHSISPDNGTTWYEIRPKESSGTEGVVQTVPELLDFNGVDPGTIVTNSPVTSLRYKLLLERNGEAFVPTNPVVGATEKLTTELHSAPTTTPFQISLQNTPIDGSVSIVDPFLGSRGLPDVRYSIQMGKAGEVKVLLPWKPIPPELTKVYSSSKYHLTENNPLRLLVDGIPWTRGSLSGDNKYYQVNLESGEVIFGDGDSGRAPHTGASIEVYLDEERVYPSSDIGHTLTLKFPIAPDPEGIKLFYISPLKTKSTILAKGATTHKLEPYIDSTEAITFSDVSVFASKVSFIDGSVELTGTGKYSIDTENGIVYSNDPTTDNLETTVTFSYYPRTQVSSDRYTFINNSNGITNVISILDSAWQTSAIDAPESIPSSVKYFCLAGLNVTKGSLVFSGTGVGSIFAKEVPFIDGRTELLGVQKTTEKLSAITSTGNVEIPLSLQISSDLNLQIVFSNTSVFTTVQGTPEGVDSPGDYYIDRTAGSPKVLVNVSAAVSDPGEITYYFVSTNALLSGAYSVNYETGEVYIYTSTTSGLTVSYRFSNYVICYPVARMVSGNDYTVDYRNKKVILKDREIIKRKSVEKGKKDTDFYRVSYRYSYTPKTDIQEYKDYYTPALASYKLKILTQNRLAY